MSENQLQEAFVLLKQGDKAAAVRMVEDVLREDRNNVNAWWLYSHLQQDEEKQVKALQRILALSPEHAGARKKLAALRPEYANLAPRPEPEKVKQQKTKAHQSYIADNIMGLILLIGITIAACFGLIWGVIYMQAQLTPTDKFEHTPQDIAAAYYTALYKEDIDTLYAITCPARYERLDEMIIDFEGLNPADVMVDLSQTRFELYNQSGNKAYVQIYGSMVSSYGGLQYSLNWQEDARANGYDSYGIFFERINNVWLVCNQYSISDMLFHDE